MRNHGYRGTKHMEGRLLYMDFQLHGGLAPLTLTLFKGQLYFGTQEFIEGLQLLGDGLNCQIWFISPLTTVATSHFPTFSPLAGSLALIPWAAYIKFVEPGWGIRTLSSKHWGISAQIADSCFWLWRCRHRKKQGAIVANPTATVAGPHLSGWSDF